MIDTVVYHGAGYVGLTGGVHFAKKGVKVVFYDPNRGVVDGINRGEPRAGEFLSYIDDDVSRLVKEGLIQATDKFDDIVKYNTHVLAVPTEIGGIPDMSIVKNVAIKLMGTVPEDGLIIIESTISPGTTHEILMEMGSTECTLYIAVCPRRDWFADKDKNVATLPRVVGGLTQECTKKAVEVLSIISNNILTTDYRTAELCKSLENALLHVQVMFAHQFAAAYPHHDTAEALKLAGTHWRLTPLHLGFGTGGRCVPLGTKYLLSSAPNKEVFSIAKEADVYDDKQRGVIVGLAYKHTPVGGRILVLGAGYRKDFKDIGQSPGVAIAQRLKQAGVDVYLHDPLWKPPELTIVTGVQWGKIDSSYDTILLATPHTAYENLPPTIGWHPDQYVLDAMGLWLKFEYLFNSVGVDYRVVGETGWID